MIQPSSMLLTVCVLGAAQMAHGSHLVEGHHDLANCTGLVEEHAGLQASAIALSKWPADTTTITKTQVITSKPAWTTLSTVTISHSTTMKGHTSHTTILSDPIHSHGKRADLQQTLTLLPDGTLSTIRDTDTTDAGTTVTMRPTIVETEIAPSDATSTGLDTSTFSSSIAKNTKVVVVSRTTTVPPTPDGTDTVIVTSTTTPAVGPTIVVPSGISQLSITTIKPVLKTKIVNVKSTTTVPATGAVIPIVHSTSTSTTSPTSTHKLHQHHRDIWGYRCTEYHFGCHPFDFISKKWLWLLTIPLVLMAASLPMFIWAIRRLRRTLERDNEKGTAPVAPSQTVVTDAGGATAADEGRGRVATPADQTTQTVTSAPGGKVTTVPATTTEHVETVPQHDGTTLSADNGSFRGREGRRVPLLMRF